MSCMTDYKAVLAFRPMPCWCRAFHFSCESSVFWPSNSERDRS
nr:MAG TPA: hypothetical protein [Caudoviricetes sp.]